MPKPNTRQSSVSKTSPQDTVVNTNLIDLSRGVVGVATRGHLPTQGRGRRSTPVVRKPSRGTNSEGSQSSTSTKAVRTSPVPHSITSLQSEETGNDGDILARTLPGEDAEVLNNSTSNMATGGVNKEGDRQGSGGTTMDDVLVYFQEAIRNIRDEFRRELSAVRDSVGATVNNRTDSTTPGISSQPSGSQGNTLSYASFVPNFKIKDWKISYNGEGSVSDFLFRLDTLVKRTQCPNDYLMSNFHILLSGKAEIFYWDYIRQYQSATYPMLKTALSKEFGSRESDHEILLKISTRKQLPRESYDDYHSFIVRWNLRLTNPMPDISLIDIIKKNVHAELKVMLFIANPSDLGNLRDMARKAEKILLENRNANPNRQRQVNEIAVENIPMEDEVELDPQVEALKLNKSWTPGDYSKINCWNCLQLGHSYIYCPEETRHVFCYKCGQRGVTTVKCVSPHKGNRRRSEWATGDARSSK